MSSSFPTGWSAVCVSDDERGDRQLGIWVAAASSRFGPSPALSPPCSSASGAPPRPSGSTAAVQEHDGGGGFSDLALKLVTPESTWGGSRGHLDQQQRYRRCRSRKSWRRRRPARRISSLGGWPRTSPSLGGSHPPREASTSALDPPCCPRPIGTTGLPRAMSCKSSPR
jgi:hypothetical protein